MQDRMKMTLETVGVGGRKRNSMDSQGRRLTSKKSLPLLTEAWSGWQTSLLGNFIQDPIIYVLQKVPAHLALKAAKLSILLCSSYRETERWEIYGRSQCPCLLSPPHSVTAWYSVCSKDHKSLRDALSVKGLPNIRQTENINSTPPDMLQRKLPHNIPGMSFLCWPNNACLRIAGSADNYTKQIGVWSEGWE